MEASFVGFHLPFNLLDGGDGFRYEAGVQTSKTIGMIFDERDSFGKALEDPGNFPPQT